MKRILFVVAIVVVIAGFSPAPPLRAGDLPRAEPEQVGLDPAKLDQATRLFRDASDRRDIAGAVLLVARHGKIAFLEAVGKQDIEANVPMSPGSIFRIASMTKPITSVAAMMLVEQGKIDLSDPISRYLPEFKFMKVAMPRDGSAGAVEPFAIVQAYRPITVRDLLTHTSGLCYRFTDRPVVGRLYAEAQICDGLTPSLFTMAENVQHLAALPLHHQPGTAWEYGLNTDVLGRLVEVASGQSLDAFFTEHILEPLEMNDTSFRLPDSKRGRLAGLYEPGADGHVTRTADGPTTRGALIYSPDAPYRQRPGYFSGGAGLLSTAADYARFLQMLLNRGLLDGKRILQPHTVAAMTRNQTGALPLWIGAHGTGFGFGFGITLRPDNDKKDPVGTFSWGGIYYTDFWVDPAHELIGVMMTQIFPSGQLRLRDEFHRLVNESVRQP